jgi:ribosomal protein S18 acetylase RimI-like enzyme
MQVRVLEADYSNPWHAHSIVELLDSYARDPMGGGSALTVNTRQNLVASLSKIPGAFSILAIDDATAGATADETDGATPVGLVNCFQGFSTFACKPLVNIHDVFVLDEYRGRGISLKMLKLVESIARQRNCCKLTLEVLSNNNPARRAYQKLGFSDYQLDPGLDSSAGKALFWEKKLEPANP